MRLILILCIFLQSCSLSCHIYISPTGEYEDHVEMYKENQEYHQKYSLDILHFQENFSKFANDNKPRRLEIAY